MKRLLLWGFLMLGVLGATVANGQWRTYQNLYVAGVNESDTLLITPPVTNVWKYRFYYDYEAAADSITINLFMSGTGDSVSLLFAGGLEGGTGVSNEQPAIIDFDNGPPIDSVRIYCHGAAVRCVAYFWY